MLIYILTKNEITSCRVNMMLFIHFEVKPLMTLTTVIYLSCALIFFFQAEDGIRDTSVTGVQTCALPIFFVDAADGCRFLHNKVGLWIEEYLRSEERRVGKECRSLCWQMTYNTKYIDIIGLQAAYANLHIDQERDYFMQS